MSQPRTVEERLAALEAEVAKMRPSSSSDAPRDTSTMPAINVRERMEAQPMRAEAER